MKQYIYGIHAIESLLINNPEKIINFFVLQERQDKKIISILRLAEKNGIKVQAISRKKLDHLLATTKHQGVAASITSTSRYHEADLLPLLDNLTHPPLLLILDGVQDPHNLGACLRSANAAGVDAVIAPKDNAVGLTAVAIKAAAGAAETTPFIQVTNLARTMRTLKERGIWLFGASAEANETIYQAQLTGPLALVLGAEGKGLRHLTATTCDYLLQIPMFGTVASLNVSVATALCLFEAKRQRG